MSASDPAPAPGDWTGPRPLVTGLPVFIGAIVVGVVLVAMFASVVRRPGLASRLSQDYTAMMAGSLAAEIQSRDPSVIAGVLVSQGLPFTPRIAPLDPDFVLLGGRRHDIEGRKGAAWFYRSPSAEMAIGEAFEGRLDELGPADETRAESTPALHLFRKTTQTIVCWQADGAVYAFTSTLPTETVVALARRHAAVARTQEVR